LEDKVIKKGNQKYNSSKQFGNRVNGDIRGLTEVRLVGSEGEALGLFSLKEAKNIALDRDLDLVEISPNAKPPVCKIMDYGKFVFDKQKQLKDQKKKQKNAQLKEIKFRPNTDLNDYNVKLKSLIKFLNAGDKTKVTLRFRGREIAYQQSGMELLNRVKEDLKEYSVVESFPKVEGRQAIMVLAPKKK